jgi:hypothetical protein
MMACQQRGYPVTTTMIPLEKRHGDLTLTLPDYPGRAGVVRVWGHDEAVTVIAGERIIARLAAGEIGTFALKSLRWWQFWRPAQWVRC